MRIVVGLLTLPLWLLYAGQLVSIVNFGVAQRLGLQEKPDNVDPVHSRLELWTARWDICWLWTLPVALVAVILSHPCCAVVVKLLAPAISLTLSKICLKACGAVL